MKIPGDKADVGNPHRDSVHQDSGEAVGGLDPG
jgi:hypothetical protein